MTTKPDSLNLHLQESADETLSFLSARLQSFIRAERSMYRLELISVTSLVLFFLGLGILAFTFFIPQMTPGWLFWLTLTLTFAAIVLYFFLKPLLKLHRKHRNRLSQLFHQHGYNIELLDNQVILRNRQSSQIALQHFYESN